MLYAIESADFLYWFNTYKWHIIIITILTIIWYLNRLHGKNLKIVERKKESDERRPKSIGEALLLQRQKSMVEIHEKNRDLSLKKNEKVRKFRFSTQELTKIEKRPEATTTNNDDDQKIVVNFKLLETFDIILPKLKGTYNDFLEAIEKFCAIFTDSQDNIEKIQRFLHQKKYREIVTVLDAQINNHEETFLLKKSKFYRWLQYGGLLEIEDENGICFVIDHHNLLLCDEIYLLIQELLIKYYNEHSDSSIESIEDFIDNVSLETLEELYFTKTYSQMGEDVAHLLVEDFFSTIDAKKKDYTIKYRSLRLIFGNDNQNTYRIGELIWTAMQDIQKVHDTIKEKVALSTAEIQQLIVSKDLDLDRSNKILDPKPVTYTEQEVEEEEKLLSLILEISEFLKWYPQDETLLGKQDMEIMNYFDRLLYSRKSRFSIIRDVHKQNESKIFDKKATNISSILKYTDQIIKKMTVDKIIGTEIKIAVPRQSEDYFPVRGIVHNIYIEETELGNITKLEVTEKNSLRSTVTFTGNNIDFISYTGSALS